MKLSFSTTFCGLAITACCAITGLAADLQVQVTGESGAPVSEAIVVALPAASTSTQDVSRTAMIDQVKKEFVPYVSVVRTGTAVSFPNFDNIRHHVYSFSPARIFELKLYKGTPAKPIVFDKPGLVVLGCNIHDWMVAYVYVVDTPYFAKTDSKGSARLENLPAGQYELRVMHPEERAALPPNALKFSGPQSLEVKLPIAPRRKKGQDASYTGG